MQLIRVLAAVVLPCAVQGGNSIGDRLLEAYLQYHPLPLNASAAVAAGWSTDRKCVPPLGMGFTHPKLHVTLHYTSVGPIAGLAMDAFGSEPATTPMNLGGAWQPVPGSDNHFRITVSFRDPTTVCDSRAFAASYTDDGSLGDRLVVNAAEKAQILPTTRDAAVEQGWIKGACFSSMGTHYFKDLTGNLSWSAANLYPVAMMFDEANPGRPQALLFASTSVQQGVVEGTNGWDPAPLPNFAMCKNFCDNSCHFTGTNIWSTGHFFFNDIATAVCDGGCAIGCCPKSNAAPRTQF